MSTANPHLWTVILAGGVGSRFWPVSTPARPKQLLPLASEQPLIRDTVDRIVPLVPADRLRILTGGQLSGALLSVLPELGGEHLLLEPRAAGTGPVLAWAAAELERLDPDAVMVSLHADHVIHPPEAFRALIARAAELAVGHRRLFTIGAPPTRAETGYGYIRLGAPLDGLAGDDHPEPGNAVAEFVEKPDRETAEEYLASGRFLWNTGLFVWRCADMLDQLQAHAPEFRELVPMLRRGESEEFFRLAPTISIDEALLERSDRSGVVRATFAWDDVGAWDAVSRTRPADERGNVLLGDAHAVECDNTVLYADEGPVVGFGVENLVVVRTGGVTFVAHRDRSPDLKRMLQQLPDHLRDLR
ncbi:mannose-1-phosphate guanylyltransferase [Longimicrobium terrae]|uniref:Mannose-1-phosphate guanylyltransferase n=1 Tax=Longimicrobium terrae TaxID=1639882 RepID=A0A841GWG0_9BACT|nr:sugar phosphate nucleotidyltransferase [Longimicrobium terrae]MBB4635750.1 mannose-1-phosphate guanylyltransferase [Longimicrobium terrae]MBB6070144.1 mannose-1-phosphate guanylyltransferase [Longimicrobium terrae]NNC33045.1 mannose-1-phosphate guanylyltransferase [Longimicrobium terrae]